MPSPKIDLARFTEMYTKGAEKLTGPFAKRLLTELGLDQTTSCDEIVLLDECCGYDCLWTLDSETFQLINVSRCRTGIVQKELAELLTETNRANVDLTCMDLADAMINFTTKRLQEAAWPYARVVKGDVMDTGLPSSHFTHITLTFGPEIFRNAKGGYEEIYRMLKPGGRVGTALWAIHGYTADVRDALATLPAHVPDVPLDHTLQGLYHSHDDRWYDSAWARDLVASAGFTNVNARIIPFTSRLPADEYLGLLSMLIGRLTREHWTPDDQSRYGEMVLDAIANHFETKYGKTGIATCKSIPLYNENGCLKFLTVTNRGLECDDVDGREALGVTAARQFGLVMVAVQDRVTECQQNARSTSYLAAPSPSAPSLSVLTCFSLSVFAEAQVYSFGGASGTSASLLT